MSTSAPAPKGTVSPGLQNRLQDDLLVKNLFSNWESLAYLPIIIIMYTIGRITFPLLFRAMGVKNFDLADQLINKDNKAVAVAFAGYLGGIGLVMWGALSDQLRDSAENLWTTVVWMFIGLFMLILCNIVNEYLVVTAVNNKLAIVEDRNLGVGIFEGCAFIGSGFVVMGVISGGIISWETAVASAFILFGLSQTGFIIFSKLYEKIAPYDPQKLLTEEPINPAAAGEDSQPNPQDPGHHKGNVAVGTSYGLMCIAISLYMSNTCSKDESVAAWGMWFGIGMVASFLMRIWVDKRLIPGVLDEAVSQGHWGPALIEGTVLVCMGFLSWTFIEYDPCFNRATNKDNQAQTYSERLTDIQLLKTPFTWYRLVFLCLIVLIMWLAKYPFAIPIYLTCRKLNIKFRLALVFSRDDAAKKEYENRVRRRLNEARKYHLPDDVSAVNVVLAQRVKVLESTVKNLCEKVGTDVSLMSREQTSVAIEAMEEEDNKDEVKDPFRVPDCLKKEEFKFMEDTAVAISFSGFLLAISFVIYGPMNTVPSADDDAGQAIGYTVVWMIIGCVLVTLSMYVQQRFILPEKYMRRGKNKAIACVEFGQFIAAGLIVGVCVSGDGGDSWADDFVVTAIYYVLNTFCLICFAAFYQAVTKYDDVEHLAHGNVAAGLSFGLTLIAYGIILSNPVAKDDSLLAWVAFAGCGVVYLHVVRFFVDKLVLIGSDLDLEIARDVNWGASLIEGVVNITSALCLTTFLRKNSLDVARGVCAT